MQFLVDAQLPPALTRWTSAQGYPACHVADIGMASARDPEIWDRAYNVRNPTKFDPVDIGARRRSQLRP
jgi:predicted nuclease of predicted toxin-antitoxin system